MGPAPYPDPISRGRYGLVHGKRSRWPGVGVGSSSVKEELGSVAEEAGCAPWNEGLHEI